jgi:hypothetical protein
MSAINFYKIVCNNTGAIYVGSTCKTIQQRLQRHEYDYRNFLNERYHFVSSFIILENKNYSIELIDTVLCTDKKHRDTLERLYILNNDCVNMMQPGRNNKQWRSDNKEKIKQYREDNKEKIKQYREDNKEKLNEYTKQYRKDNKERSNEYAKQYREDNKERINEKFNCLCSGKYTLRNKARHLKSKLHLYYIEAQKQEKTE